MQNKIFDLFLILFSAPHLASTEEPDEVDCSNTELVTSIFNEPIDLNYVGIIKIYSNVNIVNITTTKNNDFDTNYIDARLQEQPEYNKKNLVIFSTPLIQNYAKEQSINRITLRISLGCDLGRQRTLIFYQPFKEGNYFSPVFSQSSYELLVPMPLYAGFELSTFAVIAASDDDLTNNDIHFSSNNSARFHIAVGTKFVVNANRKSFFANLTLERIYLSLAEEIKFEITATDNGSPPLSSNATIIIHADPSNSLPPTPRFTKLVYSAALSKNLTLQGLQVALEPSTYNADVNFSIIGSDKRHFLFEQRDNVLEIYMLKDFNVTDLINNTLLELEIKAENRKLTEVSKAVVLITLPSLKDCSILSKSEHQPKFASNTYKFSVKPNQLGYIGSITATTETNATVRYSLHIVDDYLASCMSINSITGELQLLSYVSPGIYNFNITAQNVETLSEAKAAVRLLVDMLIQCDAMHPQAGSALLIKYIEEEKEHRNIMNTTLGDCEFKIFSMQPNDKAYISIDESTKMLTTIAIDREDPIFSGMSEPQIQLKLKLNCNAPSENLRPSQSRINNHHSLILNEDIPYTRDTTIITFFIVDVNDNAPKFLHPSKPIQLGYPELDICLELFPEYLTQIKAYDRDHGLNAKIRYSMRPNSHFAIDASNGIIYPRAQAFQHSTQVNETTLLVTATDRDGARDGLTTAAVIFVKRLNAHHFSLLTFQTRTYDEFDGLLQQLATRSKYQVESIRTAILPYKLSRKSTLSSRSRRDIFGDGAVFLKSWIYALDANEPVLSVELKRRLSLFTRDINVTLLVETYDEVGLIANSSASAFNLSKPPGERQSDLRYIIVISLLALVVALLLSFLLWQFCMRPQCYQSGLRKISKLKNESRTHEVDMTVAKNLAYEEQYLPESASAHSWNPTKQVPCSDDVKRSNV